MGEAITKIAVHQPHYLPWLGLVHKIALADRLVLLDDVQFTRRNYQHRTQYPTASGGKWLVMPVKDRDEGGRLLTIAELGFGDDPKRVLRRHFETLQHRYSSAPGWKLSKGLIREMYESLSRLPDVRPVDVMLASMRLTLGLLGVRFDAVAASALSVGGRRDEHNMQLTRAAGGTVYLSGQGARAYMREEIFETAGIAVEYQQFEHPVYHQRHGGPFVPGCLALDYYFEDPDGAVSYFQEVTARATPALAARTGEHGARQAGAGGEVGA